MKIYPEYKLGSLAQNPKRLVEALVDNLGGSGMDALRFDRITVGSGGAITYTRSDDESAAETELIAVPFLQFKIRRMWLDKGTLNTPPDCYSPDGLIGVGDPGTKLQAEGKGCIECPYSRPGSGGTQWSRWCKEQRLVPILLSGENIPVLLQVPPTSLNEIDALFRRFLTRDETARYTVVKFTLESKQVGGRAVSIIKTKVLGRVSEDCDKSLDSIRGELQKARQSIVAPAQLEPASDVAGTLKGGTSSANEALAKLEAGTDPGIEVETITVEPETAKAAPRRGRPAKKAAPKASEPEVEQPAVDEPEAPATITMTDANGNIITVTPDQLAALQAAATAKTKAQAATKKARETVQKNLGDETSANNGETGDEDDPLAGVPEGQVVDLDF